MAVQKVIADKCIGCGICVQSCPADVFRIDTQSKKAFPKYAEECVVCCICFADCPQNAIVMSADVKEQYLTAWG